VSFVRVKASGSIRLRTYQANGGGDAAFDSGGLAAGRLVRRFLRFYVELRFFGGLTVEEVAEVIGVSTATVEREWRMARAWLHHQLTAERPK